jgi:hypothetical protein
MLSLKIGGVDGENDTSSWLAGSRDQIGVGAVGVRTKKWIEERIGAVCLLGCLVVWLFVYIRRMVGQSCTCTLLFHTHACTRTRIHIHAYTTHDACRMPHAEAHGSDDGGGRNGKRRRESGERNEPSEVCLRRAAVIGRGRVAGATYGRAEGGWRAGSIWGRMGPSDGKSKCAVGRKLADSLRGIVVVSWYLEYVYAYAYVVCEKPRSVEASKRRSLVGVCPNT